MATSKTLAPTNVTISIPAMTDAPDASVFSNCVDKEADAINALNSQLTSQYGVVITDVQYEICANVVTVYLNGVTVTDSTGWTKLADLPSGLNTRYSAHFKAMSGQDIQIAGSAINYRGSAGNVFGACTYVRG